MGLRDPFSSASHLFAAVMAAFAAAVLFRITPATVGRRTTVALFGGSMVAMYLVSGLFHAVPVETAAQATEHRFLQTLDRSAIFVFIAGTNTPIMFVLLASPWRQRCLGAIWGLAIVGVISLWALPQPPFGIAAAGYVVMEWLGWVPAIRYLRAVGWRGMRWVAAGAVAYSAGAVCDVAQWPNLASIPVRVGPHEVFHVTTVAGSIAMFVFIAKYVVPYRTRRLRLTSDGRLRTERTPDHETVSRTAVKQAAR